MSDKNIKTKASESPVHYESAYLIETLTQMMERSQTHIFGKLSLDKATFLDVLAKLRQTLPASGLSENAIDEMEQLAHTGKTLFFGSVLIDEETLINLMTQLKPNSASNAAPANETQSAMPRLARLHRGQTLLLIVDVQERLLPAMSEAEQVEKNCVLLARMARQLGLPVIVTEQYPEKLGSTVASISEIATEVEAFSKMLFSACTGQTVNALHATRRSTVLMCGIEAHVCVLQTALDLIEQGFNVFVPYDAIASRQEQNKRLGWERMREIGVLPTSTESAIFELLREAGTPDFKALLPFIK